MSGWSPLKGRGDPSKDTNYPEDVPVKTLGETLDFEEQLRTAEIQLPTPEYTQEELRRIAELNSKSTLFNSDLRVKAAFAEIDRKENHGRKSAGSFELSETDEDEKEWLDKYKQNTGRRGMRVPNDERLETDTSVSTRSHEGVGSASRDEDLNATELRQIISTTPLRRASRGRGRGCIPTGGRSVERQPGMSSKVNEISYVARQISSTSSHEEEPHSVPQCNSGASDRQSSSRIGSSSSRVAQDKENVGKRETEQCSSSRRTILGNLLRLQQKKLLVPKTTKSEELDSDDSEPDEDSRSEINRSGEPSGLQEKSSTSQAVKVLVQKPQNMVAYGCISVADIPSRLVLVRGPLLLQPLEDITKFEHYELLKRGIVNCGLHDLNYLQKSVTPHILRGDDCFIVAISKSGKRLSYLMPILGSLIKENLKQKRNDCKSRASDIQLGPLLLIICNDFESALRTDEHVEKLLSSTNRRNLIHALICDNERETRRTLENGVDIMVTTISYAYEMLKKCNMHFKFDRLGCCVFEDLEVLLRRTPKEFEAVRNSIDEFVKKCPERQPYQRIFSGHAWSTEMEELYLNLKGIRDSSEDALPIVHIQSGVQAIHYSKLKWKIHHVAEEDKLSKLVGLLRSSVDLLQHKKIFIVCNTPDEAIYIHKQLEDEQILTCLAETETMTNYDFKLILRQWEDSPHEQRIMVLDDKMVKGLNIHDVTCLIHYNLPEKSSKDAIARFSCMWGYFRDISEEKLNPSLKYQRSKLESHFLLTGSERGLYSLKKNCNQLGCSMPDQLNVIADSVYKKKLEKQSVCPGLQQYGKCMETFFKGCDLRHHFLLRELEKKPIIPRNGEIEVRIAACINPSLYVGQILRSFEMKDNRKKLKDSFINTFLERTKKLNLFFQNQENRIPPESFDSGTLCAVEIEDGFTRAKIVKVMTYTEMLLPKTIKVFCIDNGEQRQVEADSLFKLPAEFEELSQLSVNLILANLKPTEGETKYREQAVQKARKLTVDKILHGKVRFATDTTVWVNPLVELSVDYETKESVKKSSIRIDIIKQRIAENNDWHIENIIDTCRSVGFTCPEIEEMENNPAFDNTFMSQFFQLGDEVRWAFLRSTDIENPEIVEVWASFTKDPYNIFGTVAKFDEQLDSVISELNSTITDLISEKCQKYESQFYKIYEEGLVVAAYDRLEKTWSRAMITKQHGEGDGSCFDVFFVDVGDYQCKTTCKELFPMPSNLVTRLPFQAIGLKLSHVTPANSNELWNDEVQKLVISLTLDENNDGRKLDVVALTSLKHPYLPCRYYSAILIMDTGDDIGSILVDRGVAQFVDDGEETVSRIKSRLLATYNQMYDNREQESDDDSEEGGYPRLGNLLRGGVDYDDDDRWDIGGLDGLDAQTLRENVLRQILPKNGFIKPVTRVEHEDEIPSTLEPQNQQNETEPMPSTSQQQGETPAAEAESKPRIPAFSDLLHPKVYWRQTKDQIMLMINHPDIKKYTLIVEGQMVSFRTLDPPGYGFDIELFGRVESNPNEFLTGQYLRIKLKKRVKNWKWQKPLKSDVKLPWFKEDIDYDHSSAEEEEEENNGKKFSSVPINWEEFDSGESDDDGSSQDSEDEDAEAM